MISSTLELVDILHADLELSRLGVGSGTTFDSEARSWDEDTLRFDDGVFLRFYGPRWDSEARTFDDSRVRFSAATNLRIGAPTWDSDLYRFDSGFSTFDGGLANLGWDANTIRFDTSKRTFDRTIA